MLINIKNLKCDLKKIINELSLEFDIVEDKHGISVVAMRGNENVYKLKNNVFSIEYTDKRGFIRGIRHLFTKHADNFEISENSSFKNLGIMLDCSRNAVYTVDTVKKLIRNIAFMGYNYIQLYTEDTFEVNNEPYLGYFRGRYSVKELKEIDSYAIIFGIELIPCIQTLAHLNGIFKWAKYKKINDAFDILLAGDENTYELLNNVFSTLAEVFTSRNVNIGMDEAVMVGRGEYFRKNGYKDQFEIMLNHLAKVNKIANKYGFRCRMYGDMFFDMPDKLPISMQELLPENLDFVCWNYVRKDISEYKELIENYKWANNKIIFAGGAWTWVGFCPHSDFALKTFSTAMDACMDEGIDDIYITLWGDDGAECSVFSVLPVLFSVAEKNYFSNNIEKDFQKIYKIGYEDFMRLGRCDRLLDSTEYQNPSKYSFYSDCFMGFLDSTIKEVEVQSFTALSEELSKYAKDKNWGYIFRLCSRFVKIIGLKHDLGIKTRRLYKEKDKDGLKCLIADRYDVIINELSVFYNEFLIAWNKEKKPNGFDVQDLRIGGLIQRIRHCRERLACYVENNTEIPELEEELLDFEGNERLSKKPVYCNQYCNIVTVNCLSHQ